MLPAAAGAHAAISCSWKCMVQCRFHHASCMGWHTGCLIQAGNSLARRCCWQCRQRGGGGGAAAAALGGCCGLVCRLVPLIACHAWQLLFCSAARRTARCGCGLASASAEEAADGRCRLLKSTFHQQWPRCRRDRAPRGPATSQMHPQQTRHADVLSRQGSPVGFPGPQRLSAPPASFCAVGFGRRPPPGSLAPQREV